MIDGRKFFDQRVKNNLRTYNIGKNATGQGNDYTAGYFKKYYKIIPINLTKQ